MSRRESPDRVEYVRGRDVIILSRLPDGTWHWNAGDDFRGYVGEAPTRQAAELAAWDALQDIRAENE